jgi:hypothetical protein
MLTHGQGENRTAQALSTTPCGNSPPLSSWAQYNGTVNGVNNNQMSATNQNLNQANGYDQAGDVTFDGVNTYLYDGEGRICALASTPVNGMTAMTGYIYDAEGTRVAKGTITSMSCDLNVNGFQATTDYILDLSGEQASEMGMATNTNGNTMAWQHTNVWADGKLLGTYDKDGLHFYLDDPLGTRRAQTDYAGVLEQTCSSLPFGDGLNCSGSLTTPTEHHFTGKERDSESGNDYFGARYFASCPCNTPATPAAGTTTALATELRSRCPPSAAQTVRRRRVGPATTATTSSLQPARRSAGFPTTRRATCSPTASTSIFTTPRGASPPHGQRPVRGDPGSARWPWSSFGHYATGVEIESEWSAMRRGNQLPEYLRYREEDD